MNVGVKPSEKILWTVKGLKLVLFFDSADLILVLFLNDLFLYYCLFADPLNTFGNQ